MSRLIDADALEREGWSLSRNRQVDAKTMVYEVKKPTDFPTIEPERNTGKWIKKSKPLDFCTEWWYECSECGSKPPRHPSYLTDFCPNCGADMRGEQP